MSKVSGPSGESCCYWGCHSPRHEDSDAPPLCTKHLIECATYIAAKVGINLLDAERSGRTLADSVDVPDGSVVYYVRIGDLVKIGTTSNLKARLKNLHIDHDPSALLGAEPGGRDVEARRHAQFRAERVHLNREVFEPSDRLLAHIASLAA